MISSSFALVAFLAAAVAPAGLPEANAAPSREVVAAEDAVSRSRTLLESAAAGLEAMKNLEAKFMQVAPSGQVSTGRFFLSRPGRLRFEYDDPNDMLIVATGGLVYVHDGELQTTDSYPVGQTPLRFLLAKDLDLGSAQVIAVEEDRHGIKITLAAKDEDLQGHLALIFDHEPMTLAGWSFLAPNGELTAVSLEAVEEKKRLSNRLFKIPEAGGTFLRDN